MPSLRLYDTLTRDLRELTPLDGQTLRFYCCGPTVYGPAHIGNFRTFVLQDVFRRTAEIAGLPTRHVRNITDVDDKTIRDSQAKGQTLVDFTVFWTERFHEDCGKLNLLPPHHEPSAVGHIPQQIALIGQLIGKGHAYQGGDGSVYFNVPSFPGYGCLSHLDSRELKTGASAGGAVDSDEYDKDSVADFALWKARKPEDGDNWWPSPWGEGRPGWHLECSAMCREYLGDTFDLHSGGIDLIFPHHENEIAQSVASSGHPFAMHWFHIAHLMVDGGKMSKSLGNLHTLSDLESRGHTAMDTRYVLVSGHYRQPLNFTFQSLADARKAMDRLAKVEEALRERVGATDAPGFEALQGLGDFGAFAPAFQALCQDLNTPDALGKTFSALREVKPAALSPDDARREWLGLHAILAALGLTLPAPEPEAEVPEEVRALAEKRWQAKQARNWAEADACRSQVTALGWAIKDGKDGYEISRL